MKGFCLEVRGPYACFTRPEMKVERVSYDVITPSAARSLFEAILWKPAIRWRITKIQVLEPIRWISVRRNEVGKAASPRSTGFFIEDDRQQRAGLFLRDVRYWLHGEFDILDEREDSCDPAGKFASMFERRASRGQCFNQPYLGCREFSCNFRLVPEAEQPQVRPIDETRDLGWMLYDMDFSNPDDPQPMFFRAALRQGVVDVPHPDSPEVRK